MTMIMISKTTMRITTATTPKKKKTMTISIDTTIIIIHTTISARTIIVTTAIMHDVVVVQSIILRCIFCFRFLEWNESNRSVKKSSRFDVAKKHFLELKKKKKTIRLFIVGTTNDNLTNNFFDQPSLHHEDEKENEKEMDHQ